MLENARQWLTMWLMRVAMKVHYGTFTNLCKLTVMQITMEREGIERFIIEEDEDGNTQIIPVRHNTTRH